MPSEKEKPDGGFRAWGVVIASFMISFIQDGILYSFGVFLPSITSYFNVGRATATVVLSIMTFMTQGSGPLASFLLGILGHRGTTLVGALLSTIGLSASAVIIWCGGQEIVVFYFITGALTGIGFGFMYLPAMTIIDHWFSTNMGLATGIAAAGSGVGQFVLSPLTEWLIEHLGLTWSFLIMGLIVSSGLLFGCAYVMPETEVQDEETKMNANPDSDENENIGIDEIAEQNCCSQIYNFSLLKKPEFSILIISNMIFHFGVYTVFGFTVDRAITFGISAEKASLLFSAMGIANCLGRVICGKIVDTFVIKCGNKNVVYVSIVILTLNGLSIILSELFTGFYGQMICSIIFGFTFGGYVTSTIVILKKLFKDLGAALGLVLFSCAVASLIGPVIVGAIYDNWLSYSVGYYSMGGSVLFSAAVLLLIPVIEQFRSNDGDGGVPPKYGWGGPI